MTDPKALAILHAEHAELGKLLAALKSGQAVRSDKLLDCCRKQVAAAQTVHNRAIGEPEPRTGE